MSDGEKERLVEQASSLPPPVPSPSRQARVLVVDDEASIVRIICRTLASRYEVTTAGSGAEALELLRGGASYHVIICDLVMPQMTGMEFHEELLKSMPESASRVVFLTGGAFTPEAQEFFHRVSNPLVEKPFDAAHLREIIAGRVAASQAP